MKKLVADATPWRSGFAGFLPPTAPPSRWKKVRHVREATAASVRG